MEAASHRWSRVVFRVSGLPQNELKSIQDVAGYLSSKLHGTLPEDIQVYSIATSLKSREFSKIVTVMFKSVPEIILASPERDAWIVPAPPLRLILDIHFKGMTPLNDVESGHLLDCITISGLASHPFGSWQPKKSDKTYMWVREELTRVPHIRSIVYGYDTKLTSSQSVQRIPDLANSLINQLQTYGWPSTTAKPIVFLAHSLGGLIVREAMVKLEKSLNKSYSDLGNLIKGAIFFGVPNFGMEQKHIQLIVGKNPNKELVTDLARDSNYVNRLNDSLPRSTFQNRFNCYWAFELQRSPTDLLKDGTYNPKGKHEFLVSRESATWDFVPDDEALTLAINANHSDMVKFTEDSTDRDNVIRKIEAILSSLDSRDHDNHYDEQGIVADQSNTETSSQVRIGAELAAFHDALALGTVADIEFRTTTLSSLQSFLLDLEQEQGDNNTMVAMIRIKSFLQKMQGFMEIVEVNQVFTDLEEIIVHLWGPVKLIFTLAQSQPKAFDSVLNIYDRIGDCLPDFVKFRQRFAEKLYMREVLVTLYKDVLDLHKVVVHILQERHCRESFEASWRVLEPSIRHVESEIERHRQLVQSCESTRDFMEAKDARRKAVNEFEQAKKDQILLDKDRLNNVNVWLCHFNCETQQSQYRETRNVCENPGLWLLENPFFQAWYNSRMCSEPALWLSGIPGAGKTILVSVIVDKLRREIANSTVAFFYCKHDDDRRNSYMAVVRSFLAQILLHNPHLLPYFHEKACKAAVLESSKVAVEMFRTVLSNCELVYLIIDGLDECKPVERNRISKLFLGILEDTKEAETSRVRCLFVSQDDSTARNSMKGLLMIKITSDKNKKDIENYAASWHMKLEKRFGELPVHSRQTNIRRIIPEWAKGMFIFAEVLTKYLYEQLSKSDVLKVLHELDELGLGTLADNMRLDKLFERILGRVLEARRAGDKDRICGYLGWIVFARRPLRWRELQGAVSIDRKQQRIDLDKMLVESSKDLFGSLVEEDVDGTVHLIHDTARLYLKTVIPHNIDFSLSVLCLTYLNLPYVSEALERDGERISADLLNGIYAFYDYASAWWAIHLQAEVMHFAKVEGMNSLLETVESFIQHHWSPTTESLLIPPKLNDELSPMANSKYYEQICQAVQWSRKQLGLLALNPEKPSQDEAIDIWQVTNKIRSLLERMQSPLSEDGKQSLDKFYGNRYFKCPRISCYYYHEGFRKARDRDNHVAKHERPFLCIYNGCQPQIFACATENELKKHVRSYHRNVDLDENEYPPAAEPQKSTNGITKNKATHECTECGKRFTTKNQLTEHGNLHKGVKPFVCDVCHEGFSRKSDCERHKKTHGEKNHICTGKSSDGSSWGCNKAFSRADGLANHRKHPKPKCLPPQVMEKMTEEIGDKGDLWAGSKGSKLSAAGRMLPSFAEFLKLSGQNP